MTPLVAFLEGRGTDAHGRTINDILKFSDAELESDHHHIQWLFPLETMSENVWESPILSKEERGGHKNISRHTARITTGPCTND